HPYAPGLDSPDRFLLEARRIAKEWRPLCSPWIGLRGRSGAGVENTPGSQYGGLQHDRSITGLVFFHAVPGDLDLHPHVLSTVRAEYRSRYSPVHGFARSWRDFRIDRTARRHGGG